MYSVDIDNNRGFAQLMFWQRKEIKHSQRFLRSARKYLHYKRDLIPKKEYAEIEMMLGRYRRAAEAGTINEMEKIEATVNETCEKFSKNQRQQGFLAENFEIIFFTFIVMLGVRTYIVQPFKIPTNSMYPSLNGVTTQLVSEAEQKKPGLVTRIWRRIAAGEVFIDAQIENDEQIVGIRQTSFINYFTKTKLSFASGKTMNISAPIAALLDSPSFSQILPPYSANHRSTSLDFANSPIPVKAGRNLFRGWVKSGDFLLADKMTYHFRRPKRGEVFIFTTKNIRGLSPPAGIDSEHYIKRLAGIPGDKVEIRPPLLYINGEPATEPGFLRVGSATDGYEPGYVQASTARGGINRIELKDHEYFALGDNSDSSADSRYWGPVPDHANIVGIARFVLWPILPHFGTIK